MSPDDVSPAEQAERDFDKTVLELLLHSRPSPWSVEEVGRELTRPIDAEDALGRLSRVGLVHRHDRFVFPTRAAIRAVELDLAGV